MIGGLSMVSQVGVDGASGNLDCSELILGEVVRVMSEFAK